MFSCEKLSKFCPLPPEKALFVPIRAKYTPKRIYHRVLREKLRLERVLLPPYDIPSPRKSRFCPTPLAL